MTVSADDRPLWKQIKDALAAEIAAGRYTAGSQLPSEAALSARYAVNRHTLRRAVAALRDAGILRSHRGAGVFVTEAPPLPYPVGPRTRFTQNLDDAGRTGRREILRLETLPATTEDAERLGIAVGAQVHLFEGIAFADDVPIAVAHSLFPAERTPDFCALMREKQSITAALAASGVPDYHRKFTRLSAEHASGSLARHLRLSEGAPVLRTVSANVLGSGEIIEAGHTWFAADRVELIIGGEQSRIDCG